MLRGNHLWRMLLGGLKQELEITSAVLRRAVWVRVKARKEELEREEL